MAKSKRSTKSAAPEAQPELPPVPPAPLSEEKSEQGETQPEIPAISDEEGQAGAEALSAEAAAETPETNTLTNLPLQEGEELYTVTKADLERNPDLVEQDVREGEQIILGPVVSPEEIILDALNEDEFVEIGEVLEQFVNNPEDQQANRFLKKLLVGMVAEGLIEVQNQVHLLLGSAYYKSGDPVTRYQTLRTVPVYAKKRS